MNATVQKSKKQIAGAIYLQDTKLGLKRKDIIVNMMDQAQLSFSGASTYYQNFKSGQWDPHPKNQPAVQPVAAAPVEIELDNMTELELLNYYNEHASFKLANFASREDALIACKRLQK